MTVSDFDSNGLIFALSESSSTESSEVYRSAVRNIMDAQGFDIMPLVDAPRIRTNVNDMTARAAYGKKGGKITHLAQRSGAGVELFPEDQILTVNEKDTIFDALERVCMHCLERPETPFVFIVVDSSDNPTALFSLRELMSDRINNALLTTYLGFSGIVEGNVNEKAEKIHSLMVMFQSLRDQHEVFWSKSGVETRDSTELVGMYASVVNQLRSLPIRQVTSPRRRESPPRTKDADTHLIDVMRHGAAGIIWHEDNPASTNLACKILCEANGFDYLTVYDSPGLLNLTYVIDKNGNRHRLTKGYKDFDDLVFDGLESLFMDKLPVFIRPSSQINTGEGTLVWPSILSFEEVKNHHGSLWLYTKLADLEEKMKSLLPNRTYRLNDGSRRHRDRLSLGSINELLKNTESDSKGIKPMESEYTLLGPIITWRNNFSHGMRKNSLNLGGLKRDNIVHTVRCCQAWSNMKKADVQTASGGKNRDTQKTQVSSRADPLRAPPSSVRIFHERNSHEADLRNRNEVQALYNNFNRIWGSRPNIHMTQVHRCVREAWFPMGVKSPFKKSSDVKSWIERFLNNEIDDETFTNSFERSE